MARYADVGVLALTARCSMVLRRPRERARLGLNHALAPSEPTGEDTDDMPTRARPLWAERGHRASLLGYRAIGGQGWTRRG